MKSVSVSKGRIATRKIAVIGLLSAVSIVMGMTGFGFIPLPGAKATIMHLPVIIGAMVEGPIVGAFIGLMFGLFSIYSAITAPIPTSFVFLDPLVAVLPRVLIGITSYYSYKACRSILGRYRFGETTSTVASAAIGTITNTVGVLGMIYLRHGEAFAETVKVDVSVLGKFLAGIAAFNGSLEVITASVIIALVMKSLRLIRR